MSQTRFSAISFPLHLYSGEGALENLTRVLDRKNTRRALVICGRSVSRKTDLIERIRNIAGERLIGVYDEMIREAPLENVQAAVEAARNAQADMLIAVGAGTVIKATRIVAILLRRRSRPKS
jgi:alcohol dehydrogenase class IV